MPEQPSDPPTPMDESFLARLKALAATFVRSDLLRLRIADGRSELEFNRTTLPLPQRLSTTSGHNGVPPVALVSQEKPYEMITSDVVGIVHVTKPAVVEGYQLDGDRELAYVEALGIRNAVRSRGPGRIVAVLCKDGDAVDYGRPLFKVERS